MSQYKPLGLELESLRALIAACEPYLKPGETPADALERHRSDLYDVASDLAIASNRIAELEPDDPSAP